MKPLNFLLPVLVIVLAWASSALFIVDERQKAMVLQFGQIKSVKEEPGLAFKLPWPFQDVVRFDDRILSRDVQPLEVTPLDDRRLVVDAFARYRIADVRKFRETLPGGLDQANSELDDILRAQLREVLGSVSSNDILSTDREALMLGIRNGAIQPAMAFGLDVVDVRLKATDLPPQNLDATFGRMRAEREREATDERARGREAAQRIEAQADRTKVELVSDANRQSEIIRGEADAKRNAIFAAAFGKNPEFFEFYRSLNAYEKAIKGNNSTLVLSPDNEFFTYLKSANPTAAPVPAQ